MSETINRAEAWQVRDVAALESMPVGVRLNSTNGPDSWWEVCEDGLRLFWQNGEEKSRKAYRPSRLFFASTSGRTGATVHRYVLNPEVLGEFGGPR